MARTRRVRRAVHTKDDHVLAEALASLPVSVHRLITRHTALLPVVVGIQRLYRAGLPAREVARLAKRWRLGLPPSRGGVVNLMDYMQSDLFESRPKLKARKRKRRRLVRARRISMKPL